MLPEMLRERRVGKLRAAVCTFPTPERLGGILDLLESGYPVKECWLPHGLGLLPELACRFNGDWGGWCELFGWPGPTRPFFSQCHSAEGNARCLDKAAMLIGLVMAGIFGHLPAGSHSTFEALPVLEMALDHLFGRAVYRWTIQGGEADRMMHTISRRILDGGSRHDLAVLCCRLLATEIDAIPGGDKDIRKTVARGLIMSAMASILATKADVVVRYFRNSGHLDENLVPRHPFVCLNGREWTATGGIPDKGTPHLLFRESARLADHGQCLVFRYGDGSCGALFWGEAQKPFADRNTPVMLTHPTIVAAPGQGAPSSDQMYDCINSAAPSRDVWVRSHFSYARKVSDVFKERPTKVCLNNCVHRTVQEILLEYDAGRWNLLSGGICACS